jgi:hypothetical protein
VITDDCASDVGVQVLYMLPHRFSHEMAALPTDRELHVSARSARFNPYTRSGKILPCRGRAARLFSFLTRRTGHDRLNPGIKWTMRSQE